MNNNSFCNSIYLAAYKVLMECKIFRCNKIIFICIINDLFNTKLQFFMQQENSKMTEEPNIPDLYLPPISVIEVNE